MPKILWVAMPLLAAAVVLVLQMLRQRWPSRRAINVWASVLLLGYVATTAGLGIFWVANQELPVFDWHYLFGYATVLLLALHLSFNFPVAWRYLTRKRAQAAGGSAAPGRRDGLTALGVLLACGAAFVLGLRHGRSELRVVAPAPAGAEANDAAQQAAALTLVERYHEFSSHTRAGLLARAPSVDWGDPPPRFKRYPNAPRVTLPTTGMLYGAGGAGLDLAALGAILFHTAGITAERAPVKLRAAPSSGALFSTELYVAARAVAGLAPGLWHYDAQSHGLERLPGAAHADAALGAAGEPALQDAPALVIASAVFRRTGHKYRDRTYRYVLADLGHALENLLVCARAAGAPALLIARFDESRLAAALGIDENEEGVLALAAFQPSRARGPARAPSPIAAAAPSAALPHEAPGAVPSGPDPAGAASARWAPPPLPAHDAPALGVTLAVHRATSLRSAAPALAQAAAAPVSAAASAAAPIALPAVAATALAPARVFASIAARRSARRFGPAPLPLEALAGVLAGLALRDPPVLSGAVRVYVVANAVHGLAPGAFAYDPHRHALLPQRTPIDLRAAAHAAALDQDVIGDAAAVFVLTIDRSSFGTDPAGAARGYRHAFIEAGLIGERIYLEAGVRGLGACAVGAFYDAEAAALVAVNPTHGWVVHLAALGVA